MPKIKDDTIYDLAEKLNLSVATNGRALKDHPAVNKKKKNKIFKLAEKAGCRANYFAGNLRTNETKTIGFMIHELNSNFINSVLSGVEKVTSEAGYDLIIAHSAESYEREVANARNLYSKQVDGLIASLSFDTEKYEHFGWFSKKGIPVIFFDRVDKNNSNSVVIIDNYKSGYEATKHLIEQGCRRIAHITSNLTRNVYAERYRGYEDALCEAGLAFDERIVLVDNLDENAGITSAQKIMKIDPMPDGAFITNDFVAAAFIITLREHNITVPDDVAVVGFNNDAIAHLIEPSLTTINYPGIEMGSVAARMIINHLKGMSKIDQIDTVVLNSELIIRQSSLKKN